MDGNKDIRVLHYSPHNENDGIAKYLEQYIAGMEPTTDVQNTLFDVSPIKFRALSPQQQQEVLNQLSKELKGYDIFHIQHEFGLFANNDFAQLVTVAKARGKKVVVSVHLSPSFAIRPAKLTGLGPRSWVNYLLQLRNFRRQRKWHLKPMLQADKLLVHNDITVAALRSAGASDNQIKQIPHPVYSFPASAPTSIIADNLEKEKGDILFCTVGMLHRYKGVFDAVRALKFLPNNYKLAIIGGMHPLSDEVSIYNKICDLIDDLGLRKRVYITGFVEDDHQMNSFIRECDVCIFPYDGSYYGNLSSGSINLAFSNEMPVIAYPTSSFKELAAKTEGAIVLCSTFAYYELARELQRIDRGAQRKLSINYAKKMAWPKMAQELIAVYKSLTS